MVRLIMRDPLFLAQKSEPATEADKQVVQNLLDTLKANQDDVLAWQQICASGPHKRTAEKVCRKDGYERWKRWWECGKGRQLLL